MPNPIRYTTGSESDALKKGNMYIGTGAVGKGPSDVTGYYQGPSVPSGGYVIYMNKVGAPGGLSYHSAANDAQLISFTNNLAGQSYTTAQQCFDYYYGQTDKVLVTQDYPPTFPYIVMDGLVLYLDAGISQSYPESGTVWTDINGLGPKNNSTLTNGPTFNSGNGGNIVLDGSNDYVNISCNSNTIRAYNSSTEFVIKLPTYLGGQRCILSYRSSNTMYIGKASGGIFVFYNGLSTPGYTVGSISNNSIAHCVVTCDATNNTLSTYINGSLAGSVSRTGWSTTYNSNVGLGYDLGGNTEEYMSGNFYLFRHYNKVLNSTEVLQNFNATKSRFGL